MCQVMQDGQGRQQEEALHSPYSILPRNVSSRNVISCG